VSRRRLRVVAAVIEREGELLVSLRHPKGTRPSQWEFPGGKLERGESEIQALVREIREELGVGCEVGTLVRRIVHPYSDTDVEIAFYRTRIVDGDPRPLSMAEIRWVPRAELEQLDFLEADRPFVAELARGEW
jgi:8-oxo-dGTP diphosphatase